MIVEIINLAGGPPLRVEAAQFIAYNDTGTPVVVAGEYGPPGTIKAAHVGDADFNQVLRAFGHGQHHVEVSTLHLPPPPMGAKLVIPGSG